MKKVLVTLLLAATAAISANAQLLYRISGKELKKPSYIVGTFHLASAPYADKIAGSRQALDETEQVYGELKMEDMTNPDTLMVMQKSMMLPEGKTLKTVLSAEQYGKLDKVLTKYMGVGLSNPMVEAQMGKLSPAALNTQLQILQYMTNHMGEFDPTSTIDQYFQTQAKNNNETVGGLETASYQMNVLFGSSIEKQVEQLDCFLNHLDYYADVTERLAKAYYAQDIKTLNDVMNEKFDATCDPKPEDMDALIYNRNTNWVKMMPGIMSEKPTLFVVGAGHLGGERGVLKLLEKNGYKIEAVK